MTIHKEGYSSIIAYLIFGIIVLVPIWLFSELIWLNVFLSFAYSFGLYYVFWFFRFPDRQAEHETRCIVSPADGTVIEIIEEHDSEYFKQKKMRVSIFMSGFNIHANWVPVSGIVKYVKYHPGRNLFAIHPKSSHLNERTSVVIEQDGKELLVRQIAGIFARRVVTYPKYGDKVNEGDNLGFIKFGSRLDLFIPLEAEILVNLGDKVKGSVSEIAVW
jgi:phosphatidylserine decarboxylase